MLDGVSRRTMHRMSARQNGSPTLTKPRCHGFGAGTQGQPYGTVRIRSIKGKVCYVSNAGTAFELDVLKG